MPGWARWGAGALLAVMLGSALGMALGGGLGFWLGRLLMSAYYFSLP